MLDTFHSHAPLILVGCGNMGRAMAEGWLQAGLRPEALFVVDPGVTSGLLPGVPDDNYHTSADDLPSGIKAQALILATKPQIMDVALPPLASCVDAGSLVISVAAGVRVARFQQAFPHAPKIVRVMPNTPAAVGAGISGLYAVDAVDGASRTLTEALMAATGKTVWVEAEADIDKVTAVSGSGPAYVFHMVECMAAAGEALGLPSDAAMALARQTVIGAGRLMEAQPDTDAGELRRRVTSPGGTTAAALAILMEEDALKDLMAAAIKAAEKRGGELGQ
ncbi:pyrroline-5-carboxylate reductase [Kordiimonas sediminis]|uniref:Pyrroline-5-carboxylate reductase n=1 Tax=Kordiimonas sediminis TaxID=1735581 RepID=A0A919E6I1_9PROT|nr:pyrroline-5-carboxylate reductase [Kordiimonas sediminis]GHF18918.1 pyrroline-5-carboxylate reductase [Kordiimonas sediminis]